jgi:hypothetical protein
MLFARTHAEVDAARRGVERLGGLSDNVIKLGPFGIGIDGALAWVPGLGEVYSLAAGGMLLLLGLRAHAPMTALVQTFTLVILRSAAGVPAAALLGPLYPVSGVVVDLFRAHKWSADLLKKAIENTLYVAGSRRDLKTDAALAADVEQARREGLRIVFLG